MYLEQRYRDAAQGKCSPEAMECRTRRVFGRGDKIICRGGWRISSQSGGVDDIGQNITYRLWLDDDTGDLWWQDYSRSARRITLNQASPHLSAEKNQVLERAENDLAANLERNGIELLTPAR